MALSFDDIGTITVTIGDVQYRLRRPTLGQLQHFTDRIREISDGVQQRLLDLTSEIKEGETPPESLADEIIAMRTSPWEYLTIPWLREAFHSLGDKPLPDDLTDAPAEFASLELAREIITWWRSVPLARGGKARR